MAAPVLSPIPGSLKQIQHYMKTAVEHDKRDPVISYYCRLYAMQRGMEIDKSSPDARQFLVGLMDYLEKVKVELKEEDAITSEVAGQAHVENYALKMFLYADNEDRAGRFNKNVVKSFYTAGMLMDVLTTFAELDEELDKNRKYAKWKAAYIHKCLKNGETPIAGPLNDEGDEAAGGSSAWVPGIGFENRAGPSVPPHNMTVSQDGGLFPTPGAQAPPSTPQDPPRDGYQPAAPSASYQPQPAPRTQPTSATSDISNDWTPPVNPAGIQLTPEQFQKSIKFCKFATSALMFEDSATAISNLRKALSMLTTGAEGN